MLNNYKTYIFGILAIVSVLLKIFEIIDEETMMLLLGTFLAGEGVGLRHAISKTCQTEK